ncbi:acyl dehydratase [Conexibacter sp. W3-3-2]|uniref:MaoC/PaaZ C-terminal domain-containing protein n=1 Tax=Conexibacter sp. W3-3-2 TaxID=2675227 RepID=UPI0012B8DA4E|nr:MaoC/PaaZ C-terminal domain-containing protein [Conexibacter sp. W3-3-2]MTD44478.1 acyl dehydratase [Conexibacter sp. W3-3-2]
MSAFPPQRIGPITRTDIVRYAGAGGDFNPIHHDEAFARAAGSDGVFAMGLLSGGIVAARLARWAGPENVASYRVRFTGQVWPGDELLLTGDVDGVAVTLQARRGDDVVVRAWATLRRPA